MRSLFIRSTVIVFVAIVATVSILFGIQAFQLHGVRSTEARAYTQTINPAGPWQLMVTFTDSGQQSPSSLSLNAGNQLANYTPFPGTGTWNMTGPNQFVYQFNEQILDPTGNQVAYVQVVQQATLSSDGISYDATGQGTVYAMDGTQIAVNATTTHATRPVSNISPFLQCVKNNYDGTYTALFGYYNRNPYTVAAPVGNDNSFSGSQAQNIVQTTVFKPGRHAAVIRVIFDGSPLVWILGGRTSTASKASRSCWHD